MPLRTHGRNGNHNSLEAKTNGHGDEESSNSDGDSSLCECPLERQEDCLLTNLHGVGVVVVVLLYRRRDGSGAA